MSAGGNYIEGVMKLQLTPGTINSVEVIHDDWCAFLNTDGMLPCDCDPEFIIHPIDDLTNSPGHVSKEPSK